MKAKGERPRVLEIEGIGHRGCENVELVIALEAGAAAAGLDRAADVVPVAFDLVAELGPEAAARVRSVGDAAIKTFFAGVGARNRAAPSRRRHTHR